MKFFFLNPLKQQQQILQPPTWLWALECASYNVLPDHVGIAWRLVGEEEVAFFWISIGDEHYGHWVGCCV
jgi:hypothetical protein